MSDSQEDIPDLTGGIEPVADGEATGEATGHSVSAADIDGAKRADSSDDDDRFLGRRLNGNFELTKKIGEGGMGNVYVATQYPLEREVAVKVLKPSETNSDGEHYFMREVKAINRLRHPNIIDIVDFGKDQTTGALFLVMEYLPGATLKKVIKSQFPLDAGRICGIAEQVLNALESAHDAGIVHCDLKPANIMVERVAGQDDFVKVLDFGIAKVADSGAEVGPYTQEGNIVGTFDYMSPEQIMRKDLDGRSDLWSIGVILYQMLTRKRIFHDKDAVSIIGRVMQMPLQPPSSMVDGVPPVLDDIVMKAMERNVNQRFQSAAKMREAFQYAAEQLRGHGSVGGGRAGRDHSAGSGVASGSLADSGLVRGDSGPDSGSAPLSGSGPGPAAGSASTSASAVFTRSGSFGDTGRAKGTMAAGTSVLDQTFSAQELKGSLLGEKRKVAALVVKQRSRDADGLDADEIGRRSRQEQAVIKEVVEHFDGDIDSLLGGTFIILFGARRARVGDNIRAIKCGVEIQARLRDLPHGADHMGLGVVYGDVSISRATDGNAYGQAIDRAVAIAGAATGAAVFADEVIAEATRDQVTVDAPRSIGGKDAAEVLRVRQADSAGQALDELDIYVPRSQVYDQLSRRGSDVRQKRGGGVGIVGETGVGKSEFLTHYVQAQRDSGWQAFLVGSADRDPQQSLAAVRAWVRQIAQTYREPRRLVTKACQSIGLTRHVEDVVVLFMDRDLGGRELVVPWESEQGFSHFCAALLHKMIRFALKKGPVLLAVDDVAVSDATTVEFLDGLIARIQTMAVLVVATHRVEASVRDHGLPGNFEILNLGGFTQNESKQFVAQLLGQTPPMDVVAQLHRRSSGNPVYLNELVRAIRRSAGPGGLDDIGELDEASAPASLHALLAERVDRLGDELRDLLRLASVLGESFREAWFFQITPSHLRPRQNLETLVDRAMLTARYDAQQRVTLAFNPRQLRQIVYQRLPDDTRIQIHTRVIEFLESAPDIAAIDPVEVPLMLAFHYRSVDGLEGAAHYLGKGAEMLLDRYDYAGAIGHLDQAIEMLDASGTPADAAERVDVQLLQLVALRESGRVDHAQRILDDMPGVDAVAQPCRADLLYEIGMTGIESGRFAAAKEALERLQQHAVDTGARTAEVKAMLALAKLYEQQNELTKAADLLMAVPDKVERIGELDLSDPDDRKLYWTAYNQLGTLFIRQKDMQRAQTFLNKALQRARQIEDHRGMVRVLSNLGALCLSIRDVSRAEDYFDNARKAAEGVGDLLNQSRILTNQGIAAMQADRLEASKSFFKQARTIAEDIGWYEGLAELAIHIKRLKQALG